MKRMLPINTHNKQNKKISQRGLAMCFGAGSICIDIGLNEYEPEKTTIHVRKGLVKLLLENEREREREEGGRTLTEDISGQRWNGRSIP